jgi:hypothetical protein
MLTEFGGEPVSGGTLPALIWREFVSSVPEEDEGATFDPPPYLAASGAWVVKRNGSWRLDNGYCRESRQLVYFTGRSPDATADCKPNEVSVPVVVGLTETGAVERLAAQPLRARVAYVPAKPGKLPGLVVKQDPAGGGLSANDTVLISVTKSRHGLVPNLVGSSVEVAASELERRGLRVEGESAPGPLGLILRQRPRPGVAASPKLTIRVVVGDGSRTGSR